MERIDFKNSRGLNLVGDFYSSKSNAAIIMSHGFTGDRRENGRFDRIADSLHQAGYNVFRFDFSGSGESDDDPLTISGQVDDLRCAIKYVQERGPYEQGLLGHSLGALISAKVYDDKIKAMVFLAPLTNAIADPYAKFDAEQMKELEQTGKITYRRDNGVRREIIIDRQILEDRKIVDQESLLSKIKCPILIVHGDKDIRVPLEDSKSAMQYLPEGSKLVVVPGAEHNYDAHIEQFIEPTVEWFKEHLPL